MYRLIISISIVTISLLGCVNNDYSKISDTLLLTPNYSLPVGARNSVVPKPLSNTDLSSIVLMDTINFSLTNLADKRSYIEWLMFRVETVNSYPGQVEIAVDYYDVNNSILGSFTKGSPLFVPKPLVDDQLGTTSGTSTIADYYLSPTEIDQAINMDYILITTTVSNLTLSDPLRANWDNFSIYTTVGVQAQINKQR